MKVSEHKGELQELINKALCGSARDIDYILSRLDDSPGFAMTRYVDYALSLVKKEEGIRQIAFYLFTGSLIQRNYCSLFFNRRGDWDLVKRAYEQGLIDEIQAYAR